MHARFLKKAQLSVPKLSRLPSLNFPTAGDGPEQAPYSPAKTLPVRSRVKLVII